MKTASLLNGSSSADQFHSPKIDLQFLPPQTKTIPSESSLQTRSGSISHGRESMGSS